MSPGSQALCPEVWNVLHDGTVVSVEGGVPGHLTVGIEIDYLRRRFSDGGSLISLKLIHCTKFDFLPWHEDRAVAGPAAFSGGPRRTILSAERQRDGCRVHLEGGTLQIVAQGVRLSLESGREIELAELMRVAHEYWDEWEARKPD